MNIKAYLNKLFGPPVAAPGNHAPPPAAAAPAAAAPADQVNLGSALTPSASTSLPSPPAAPAKLSGSFQETWSKAAGDVFAAKQAQQAMMGSLIGGVGMVAGAALGSAIGSFGLGLGSLAAAGLPAAASESKGQTEGSAACPQGSFKPPSASLHQKVALFDSALANKPGSIPLDSPNQPLPHKSPMLDDFLWSHELAHSSSPDPTGKVHGGWASAHVESGYNNSNYYSDHLESSLTKLCKKFADILADVAKSFGSAPKPTGSGADVLGTEAAAAVKATAAVKSSSAASPSKPLERTAEIRQNVQVELAKLGAPSYTRFKVDKALLPLLDRVGLDATEFFTARACWQGVSSKRRAILEQVLDQFPSLPKDQKNVEGAMAAVEAEKGKPLSETDKYFLRYFFKHRKEMKTLFRASLSNWEGDTMIVYRGQSNDPRWGKDSTKPLGCYSYDPAVSEGWGSNFKRYRVKLNDVWSTSVISQNDNRVERELTVYSRGGKRKGEPVKDSAAERRDFQARFQPTVYSKAAEADPW